jgi:hypothetical protein
VAERQSGGFSDVPCHVGDGRTVTDALRATMIALETTDLTAATGRSAPNSAGGEYG